MKIAENFGGETESSTSSKKNNMNLGINFIIKMKNPESYLLPTTPGVLASNRHYQLTGNIHKKMKDVRQGPRLPKPGFWSSFSCDQRISQHDDDRVAPQEHFRDVAILVHWLRLLLALPALWNFCPHLLHILQDHVAMPEKQNKQTKTLSKNLE